MYYIAILEYSGSLTSRIYGSYAEAMWISYLILIFQKLLLYLNMIVFPEGEEPWQASGSCWTVLQGWGRRGLP